MTFETEIYILEYGHSYYAQERDLRNRVLLRPIGIPDFGWEHKDEKALHLLAVSKDTVIGCVLLSPLDMEGNRCQLMQMAVESDWQGKGIGKMLIEAFIAHARSEKYRVIEIHAREDVTNFYEKYGFLVVGKPFEEVGVVHRHMHLVL